MLPTCQNGTELLLYILMIAKCIVVAAILQVEWGGGGEGG